MLLENRARENIKILLLSLKRRHQEFLASFPRCQIQDDFTQSTRPKIWTTARLYLGCILELRSRKCYRSTELARSQTWSLEGKTWSKWISFVIWAVKSYQVLAHWMKCHRACLRLNGRLPICEIGSVHATSNCPSNIHFPLQRKHWSCHTAVADRRCMKTVASWTPISFFWY